MVDLRTPRTSVAMAATTNSSLSKLKSSLNHHLRSNAIGLLRCELNDAPRVAGRARQCAVKRDTHDKYRNHSGQ